MVEQGFAFPETFCVGADSHSNMYGGIGCLGTPVVRSDVAILWSIGKIWWSVPPVVRIIFNNKAKHGITGKDIILNLIASVGRKAVLNKALEFDGDDSIYFGRNNYIEYHSGTIPIILSATHGGWIEPDEIPDRTEGTTVTDINTYQLTKVIMDTLESHFGGKPHVILCLLERLKLDANRNINDASDGNIYAERAWKEYHHYIDVAKELVAINYGSGILFDIHGHGENPDGFYDLRTWLGYLISGNDLEVNIFDKYIAVCLGLTRYLDLLDDSISFLLILKNLQTIV